MTRDQAIALLVKKFVESGLVLPGEAATLAAIAVAELPVPLIPVEASIEGHCKGKARVM